MNIKIYPCPNWFFESFQSIPLRLKLQTRGCQHLLKHSLCPEIPSVESIPLGSFSCLFKYTSSPWEKNICTLRCPFLQEVRGVGTGMGDWGGELGHHFSRKPGLLHHSRGLRRWAGLGLQVKVCTAHHHPLPPCQSSPLFPSFPQLVHMAAQEVGCWANLPHPSPPRQVIRCRQCSPFQLPTDPALPAISSRRLPRPTGTRPGCPMQERMSSQASGPIR